MTSDNIPFDVAIRLSKEALNEMKKEKGESFIYPKVNGFYSFVTDKERLATEEFIKRLDKKKKEFLDNIDASNTHIQS